MLTIEPKPCFAMTTSSCFIEKNIPAHVGGEHQVEGLDRVVDERVRVVAAVDAGAVDGHVAAAILAGTSVGAAAGGDLDGVADGVLVADVGDDIRRCASRVVDQFDGLFQSRRGATGDGDCVALDGEGYSCGASDAGAAAGDESALFRTVSRGHRAVVLQEAASARNAITSATNSLWCWKRNPCAESG